MITNLDINNIDAEDSFLEHKNILSPFRDSCLELYDDNPNKDKIVVLLDYWILNIYCLKKCYGAKGVIDFCDSVSTNPQRFSFLYEFSNQAKGVHIRKGKSNPNQIIFKFLNFFLKNLYTPGATLDSFMKRLANKVSTYYLLSIPTEDSGYRKKELFKLLDKIMTNYLSDNEIAKIKEKIPVIFYSKDIHQPFINRKIYIKGSSASFLEYTGIEKVFLFNTKLKIEGHQHGGGYDIFKIDYFVDYEKLLSDIFYGWGFSQKNKHQPRFKKLAKIENTKCVEKRVLWIEDGIIPDFFFYTMPHHYYQSVNKKTKNYIFDELNNEKIKYSSLFHPTSNSDLYKNLRKDDYFLQGKGLSEDIIQTNDILLFDNSGATLIHLAIENNIVMCMIISRKDFRRFTNLQKEWFLLLKKYNLGFYEDENGELSKSILSIKSNTRYVLPQELISFNKKRFEFA